MKKRFFAMLLALVMVVSVLPLAAFAAEDECNGWGSNGVHNWNNGWCSSCWTRCEHNEYVAGKCTRCGMNCSHQKSNGYWGTQSAFVNGVCSVCNYECPHGGYDFQNKCTTCGMPKASCTHPEYEDGKCTECGESCAHSNYVAIPEKTATCSQTGTTGGTWCATCHTIQTPATIVPVTEHNYTEFVSGTDATCTDDGVGIFKCSTCDLQEERVVPAGHDLNAEIVFVNATCANKGVAYFECSKCPFTKLDWIATLPHTEEIVPAIPATCTATGLTEGLRCSVCNETLVSQVVTDKLAHEFTVSVDSKNPTCTADGYTAYTKCATCDATEGKEVIHLLGHNFVNFICTRCNVRDGSCEHVDGVISIENATCTQDGKESFACPTCGYTYEKTLPKGHKYVNGVCTVCEDEECDHNSTREESKRATCSETGYHKTICRNCSKVLSSTFYGTTAHNYVNGVCKDCKSIGSANSTIDFNDVFIIG